MFRFRVCTRLNVVQTVVCLARGLPSTQGECIHSIPARHHEFLICRQKRRYSSLNLCLQTVYARVDGALAIKAPSTRTYTVCRVQTQARNIIGGRHVHRFCLQTKNSWCRARIEWIHSPWAEGRPLHRHTTVWTTLHCVCRLTMITDKVWQTLYTRVDGASSRDTLSNLLSWRHWPGLRPRQLIQGVATLKPQIIFI